MLRVEELWYIEYSCIIDTDNTSPALALFVSFSLSNKLSLTRSTLTHANTHTQALTMWPSNSENLSNSMLGKDEAFSCACWKSVLSMMDEGNEDVVMGIGINWRCAFLYVCCYFHADVCMYVYVSFFGPLCLPRSRARGRFLSHLRREAVFETFRWVYGHGHAWQGSAGGHLTPHSLYSGISHKSIIHKKMYKERCVLNVGTHI